MTRLKMNFVEEQQLCTFSQADKANLLIDKFLGFDKEGKEVYERDIAIDKQQRTFLLDNTYSKKTLKQLIVVSNAHKEKLERLF